LDILFVHGTGVRLVSYDLTLSLVRRQAEKYLDLACVHQCLWGERWGAKLNQSGASVPTYADQPASMLSALDAEMIDQASWRMLSEDPLFELRLLQGLAAPRRELGPRETPPGRISVQLLKNFQLSDARAAAFMAALAETSLDTFWPVAYRTIADDPEVEQILLTANRDPREVSRALARALVSALVECAMEGGHPGISGTRRTLLVALLIPSLGEQPLAPFDWVTKPLLGLAKGIGTARGRRGRRVLTDSASFLAGDIILYQVRGEQIRGFIAKCIRDLDKEVVVLAHSLGGIAAVDVLVQNDLSDRVRALITVGCQAPYFYEIDALVSLRFGQQLPSHFPRKWLNIWDPNDFLSFLAAGIFTSNAVKDYEVRSRAPFPDAHSAYWDQEAVWTKIGKFV
jgi:hypothetical protein